MDITQVVLLATLLTGVAVLYRAVRRAPREIEPTVRAFTELRSALRPAVVGMRAETDVLRTRAAGLLGPGSGAARR